MLTVWVSLVDATRENGCLQFVRGGHKSGKTARHTIGTTTSTWYTELDERTMVEDLIMTGDDNTNSNAGSKDDDDNKERELDIVTMEVKAGTAIIFGGTMPHRSLNSVSSNIRWSTDYRLHRKRPEKAAVASATGRDLDWFYAMKDSLLLRDGTEGKKGGGGGGGGGGGSHGHKVDWSEWANVDRTAVQDEGLGMENAAGSMDTFDPVIIGPWMDLWNVTTHHQGKHNAHVDRYLSLGAGEAKGTIEKLAKQGHW